MSTVGQCKVDPVTGVTGVAFTTLQADGDNGMIAAAFQSGTATRKLVGAQLQALVTALLGAGKTGSATIAKSASSVTVNDGSITTGSVVIPVITQASPDATLTTITCTTVAAGAVTFWGNAAASLAVNIAYAVIN